MSDEYKQDDEIFNCLVSLSPESLDQIEFTKLVDSLNTHGVLTKPRIGDIFRIEGNLHGEHTTINNKSV